MTDITRWSATETAARIRARKVSALEVTEAHLARMEAVNPAINAITTPVHEALDTASRLDAAGVPEDAGPLHGVPVTIKVNVDQRGYVNSNGLLSRKANLCQQDSPVVANLKAGGAIPVGRTNTPEFSMRWFTSNPLHGVSLNPWDRSLTPGGSSGAAAAAVASRIGAVAHGNDLGGSLRYPAYCCGVASIRPSMGRVPAMNPDQPERPPLTQTMSVQGPIARSIADVRAALVVMSRRDSRDPLWVNAPDSGRIRDQRITVGHAFNPFGGNMDPAVEKAMEIAIAGLEAAGLATRSVTLPHASEIAALWGTLLMTETGFVARKAMREEATAETNAVIDAYIANAEIVGIEGLFDAMARRIRYQRAWAQLFDEVDLVLMPTSLQRPFTNDLDIQDPSSVGGILHAQKPLFSINVLGLPAVSLQTHLDEGAPMGVQLVGPMHDDWFTLDVAERLEREIGTLWQQLPEPE